MKTNMNVAIAIVIAAVIIAVPQVLWVIPAIAGSAVVYGIGYVVVKATRSVYRWFWNTNKYVQLFAGLALMAVVYLGVLIVQGNSEWADAEQQLQTIDRGYDSCMDETPLSTTVSIDKAMNQKRADCKDERIQALVARHNPKVMALGK